MVLDDDDAVLLGLSLPQLLLVIGVALAFIVVLVVVGCCVGYMFKRYKLYGTKQSDVKTLEDEKNISDKTLHTRDPNVCFSNDSTSELSDDISDIVNDNEVKTPDPTDMSQRIQSRDNTRNQHLNRYSDDAIFVYRPHENRYTQHEIGRQNRMPIVASL